MQPQFDDEACRNRYGKMVKRRRRQHPNWNSKKQRSRAAHRAHSAGENVPTRKPNRKGKSSGEGQE